MYKVSGSELLLVHILIYGLSNTRMTKLKKVKIQTLCTLQTLKIKAPNGRLRKNKASVNFKIEQPQDFTFQPPVVNGHAPPLLMMMMKATLYLPGKLCLCKNDFWILSTIKRVLIDNIGSLREH